MEARTATDTHPVTGSCFGKGVHTDVRRYVVHTCGRYMRPEQQYARDLNGAGFVDAGTKRGGTTHNRLVAGWTMQIGIGRGRTEFSQCIVAQLRRRLRLRLSHFAWSCKMKKCNRNSKSAAGSGCTPSFCMNQKGKFFCWCGGWVWESGGGMEMDVSTYGHPVGQAHAHRILSFRALRRSVRAACHTKSQSETCDIWR